MKIAPPQTMIRMCPHQFEDCIDVMSEWNRSVVYRKTMVLFAERLAEP
jgi:hypothetical protein